MKIRTFKQLDNNVYRVSVYTEDWSEGDRGLMERFGEPEINTGGLITDGSLELAELDDSLQRILSESPFSAAFDERDYPNEAAEIANAWGAVIADRLVSAVSTLRLQADGFTSESVEDV